MHTESAASKDIFWPKGREGTISTIDPVRLN